MPEACATACRMGVRVWQRAAQVPHRPTPPTLMSREESLESWKTREARISASVNTAHTQGTRMIN